MESDISDMDPLHPEVRLCLCLGFSDHPSVTFPRKSSTQSMIPHDWLSNDSLEIDTENN